MVVTTVYAGQSLGNKGLILTRSKYRLLNNTLVYSFVKYLLSIYYV